MDMRKTALAAISAMALAVPAYAFQSEPNVASGADEADLTASTEITCRRAQAPTGSRIGARNICKTEREWEQIDREIDATMWNVRLGNRMYNEEAGNGCMQLGRGC